MACQSCRTFSAYWGIFGKGAVPGSLPKFLKHPLARFVLSVLTAELLWNALLTIVKGEEP